jgi:hypothetical protein
LRVHPGVTLLRLLAVGVALAACTDSTRPSPDAVVTSTSTSIVAAASIPRPNPSGLKDVCPDPIVIQLDRPVDVWSLPLVGVSAVDGRTGASAYRGAMLDPLSVLPLGIDIEIRTAATIANGSVLEAMTRDPQILLGAISTDDLLEAKDNVRAVFAPWERNDLALTWPSTLGRTAAELPPGSKPTAPPGGVTPDVIEYLDRSGLFKASKTTAPTTLRPLDGAVTSTIAPPTSLGWAQILNNPFVTKNPALTVQLVDELGWEPYPFVLAATDDTRVRYEQCLRGLIPVLQGGAVRVTRQPERLSANLGTISAKLGTPIDITATVASAQVAIENGLIGNGSDATLGDVAAARLAQYTRARAVAKGETTDEFPVLERQLRARIDARFIDPLIGRS